MTYREKQLQEEIDFLYWNLVWLQYTTGFINDETMIDEDSDKEYGWVKYNDIELINFPSRKESKQEAKKLLGLEEEKPINTPLEELLEHAIEH